MTCPLGCHDEGSHRRDPLCRLSPGAAQHRVPPTYGGRMTGNSNETLGMSHWERQGGATGQVAFGLVSGGTKAGGRACAGPGGYRERCVQG